MKPVDSAPDSTLRTGSETRQLRSCALAQELTTEGFG